MELWKYRKLGMSKKNSSKQARRRNMFQVLCFSYVCMKKFRVLLWFWSPGKKNLPILVSYSFRKGKKKKSFFFFCNWEESINLFTRQKWEVGQKACWLLKIPWWVSGTLNSKWHLFTVKLISHAEHLLPRERVCLPFLHLADRHHQGFMANRQLAVQDTFPPLHMADIWPFAVLIMV